jgi:hypothetical protein
MVPHRPQEVFSRITMMELFLQSGYVIEKMFGRNIPGWW